MTDEAPFRVLMIEDNPDDAQLVQRVLSAADETAWEIEVVECLAAGLDALDHREFDAVLMDLGLPDSVDLHGLEYVRSHAPTVPVIVLTGHDDEATGIAALRHGAQDYIVKERAKAAVLSRALRYARERGRVERALRDSEERYRLLVETASDIIYRTDERGHFTYVNAAAVHAMGYEEEHMRGRHFLELIREDHREAASQFYKRQVKEGRPQSYFEFPAVGKDGREVWIGQNVQSLAGQPGFHAIARDITERKRVEDERDQLQSRLRQFFTLSLELLCIAGFDGYFKELNTAWERTLGFTPEELKAAPFIEFVHPDDRAATLIEMTQLVEGTETSSFENRYRCKDGSYRWLLWSAAVSAEKTLVYAVARDISDRKQREQDLVHEAAHDPLTGLPNRTQVLDRLDRLLHRAKRAGRRVAALYVDLDFFKTINDTLGHSAGDEFLVKVSRRLEHCIRPGDLVGRIGGDEFVVVLHDVASGDAALKVADRIQQQLAVPFPLRGQQVRGSASIGAAVSTPRHEGAADLLRDSDAAMYQAKTAGRGRSALWSDDAPNPGN
jgi:diguanylate cyclase (GGDEF)-like protein/PAS domain S-box-containing protein